MHFLAIESYLQVNENISVFLIGIMEIATQHYAFLGSSYYSKSWKCIVDITTVKFTSTDINFFL